MKLKNKIIMLSSCPCKYRRLFMKDLMVITNGIRLHVQEYDRNGESIIFIHYGSGTVMCWNAVIPYFSEEYHVLNVEMRGHGKSDAPESNYDIDTMAEDVIGVMDELNISRANIVGSSLGGEVAASLAANYGDRVISIVCEGAIQNPFGKDGIFDIPEDQIKAKIEERLQRAVDNPLPCFDTKEELLKFVKERWASWNELKQAAAEYDICTTEDGKYRICWSQENRMKYLKAYWNTDFDSYFRKIQCPVMFIPGEEEMKEEGIRNTLKRYNDYIKKFRIVEIKGAEHAETMYDHPEEFSRAVLEFHKGI
jgi:2-succinyl-6-hydroxy-2,4-cyclohexadiene-1-carboxylate synthase